MKRFAAIALLLLLAAGAGAAWWWKHREPSGGELILYGNVDLRQVDLPFNNTGRIAEVLVQEGDRVAKNDLLARLDVSRLEPMVQQAQAQAEAQREVVARLHAGSRPEEIAQARANLVAAKADAANARRLAERMEELAAQAGGGAVSKQEVDNAKSALEVALARVEVSSKALELSLAGPRKEEVLEAEARLRANEAQLALLQQELNDAQLKAPTDSIVRNRVMEPGEMASPSRPVVILAVTDPKWVRAYVAEPDLGRVRIGSKAWIEVDSFPGRRFEGWIGFISPVAEFTPKPVQTEELRTSLVYEVRVFVKDADGDLRLGMPASVYLTDSQTTGSVTLESSDKATAP